MSKHMATVYRWRPDFQAEYAARFDWCAKPHSQANHVPMNSRGNDIINQRVTEGQRVRLQSGDWSDPDGNNLAFHWKKVNEESSYRGRINLRNSNPASPDFTAPSVRHRESVHLLLTVKDDGKPALVSYKRVNITVMPR